MTERELYREIEIIENDDSLTFEEKQREIWDLEREARDELRECNCCNSDDYYDYRTEW